MKYAVTNGYKRRAEFTGNYRGFEISGHTFNQKFDMIRNVVLVKSSLNQIVMNFIKSVFEV